MGALKEHLHDEIEAGMRTSAQISPPSSSKEGSAKEGARERGGSSAHKIQWLNLPGYKGETWNPIVGCSKVSDGCKNCYAEKMAFRIAQIQLKNHGKNGYHYTEVSKITSIGWTGETRFLKPQLTKPAKWKTPRVVFVCSMGDLFHEGHLFEWIDAAFSVMADCDKHIYIVLTKRPERMLEFYNWKKKQHGIPWQASSNVWVGVTAENQAMANARLPLLIQIPATVKFVSVEPMLGPVDVSLWMYTGYDEPPFDDVINWVICGGESGHHARPVHPDWVRSLIDQCQAAGVPFFFKQWGELLPACQYESYKNTVLVNPKQFPSPHNQTKMNTYYKVGKHLSGNLLDGVKYEQYPIINL